MPKYRKRITTAKRRSETYNRWYDRGDYNWFDPFPEILGTSIEKRVFARLTLMQIPFEFQSTLMIDIPEIALLKEYRPDFILPDAKIVIEIQGSYWHSSPAAIEADSYKYALYTAMGYRVLTWWDYEILSNLDALFARDLNVWTYRRGGRIIDPARQKVVDDLKGLRTMNARKRKPYRTFTGASKKASRKVKSSYATR